MNDDMKKYLEDRFGKLEEKYAAAHKEDGGSEGDDSSSDTEELPEGASDLIVEAFGTLSKVRL